MNKPDRNPDTNMRSDRPHPRELFALYHLGLDPEGEHRFRNIGDVAKRYNVDRTTAMEWLVDARIDPDTVGTVEFNLSKLHVDAMFLDAELHAEFIVTAYDGYLVALESATPGHFYHDHDYDKM